MDETSDTNREDTLRDLALRLLSQNYGLGHSSRATELIVGRLPDEMPADVPILEDSQVIGALVSEVMGYKGYIVILGSDFPPEQIYDLYDARLRAAGWDKPDWDSFLGRGGFTAGHSIHRMFAYYKGDEGPTLHVLAYDVADGSSEVRLNLNTVPQPRQNREQMERMAQMHAFTVEQIIPDLKPPRGGWQQPGGSSGGGNHWNSNTEMVTEQDASSVAAHYISQLEVGGWIRVGEGQQDGLAWSIWDYVDKEGEPWIGQLFIMERPLEKIAPKRRYFLSVHAHKVSGDMGSGGGWSFGPMFGIG
jgi:hypothetical protein